MSVSAHRSEFFAFAEHARQHVGKEIVVGWLNELLDAVRSGDEVSERTYTCLLCTRVVDPLPPTKASVKQTLGQQQQQPIHLPIERNNPTTPRQRSRSQVSSANNTPRQVARRPSIPYQGPSNNPPPPTIPQPSKTLSGAAFHDLATWYRVWHDKIAAGTRLLCSTTPTWTVRLSLLLELADLLEKGLVRLQSQTMSTSEPIYNSFRRLLPLVAIQLQDTQHPQVIGAAAQVLGLCATVLGPFLIGFLPTVMTLLPSLSAQMSHTAIMAIIKATQCHTVMSYLTDHRHLRAYGDYYLAVLCIVVENMHRVVTVHDAVGNAIHTIRLVNGQPLSALQQCFPGCSVSPMPLPHMAPHPLDAYYDCLSDYVAHYLDRPEESNIGVLMFWPFYICAPQIASVLFNNATADARRVLCTNIPDNWDFVIHTGLLVVGAPGTTGGKEASLTRAILASSLLFQGPSSVVRAPLLALQSHDRPTPMGGGHVTPPRSRSHSPRNTISGNTIASTATTGTWVWRQFN